MELITIPDLSVTLIAMILMTQAFGHQRQAGTKEMNDLSRINDLEQEIVAYPKPNPNSNSYPNIVGYIGYLSLIGSH